MSVLRFPASITQSAHYIPDWSHLDRASYIRLDRNECTAPTSPAVVAALTQHVATNGVGTYPNSARVTELLAELYGVAADCVLTTNGSDQAIDIALRSFLAPGATMLVARPEFAVFGHVASLLGSEIIGVPYGPNFSFPAKEFLEEAHNRQPSLIVLVNPNNPTGTAVDAAFIAEVVASFPHVPVIVDEAYYEYTGQTVVNLIADHQNLMVFRTFSKAYGLAGLRLGAIIADSSVISEFRKLRNDFDVNALALVAADAQLGALHEVSQRAAEVMEQTKPMVVDALRRLNVRFWQGAANFVLVQPDDCAAVVAFLYDRGILVRPMRAPALAGIFRMSIGTADEMNQVMSVYEEFLHNERRG